MGALGCSEADSQALCGRVRRTIEKVRSCLPQSSRSELQAELQALAQDPEFGRDAPEKFRGRLLKIADRLNKLYDFQAKGVDGIPEQDNSGSSNEALRHEVTEVIASLGEIGLFIVPVGVLESWLPVLMRGYDRNDKSRWAMLAAEKIEDVGERDDDVWAFVRKVSRYLEKKLSMSTSSELESQLN